MTTSTNKRRIKIALACSAMIAALALTGCASAPTHQTYYVDATVVDIKEAPLKCSAKKKSSSGKSLFGALIGGVIGSQIGGGSARYWSAAAGAVAGATIAADNDPRNGRRYQDCEPDGYNVRVVYLHPVTQQMITDTIKVYDKIRSYGGESLEMNIPVVVPLTAQLSNQT